MAVLAFLKPIIVGLVSASHFWTNEICEMAQNQSIKPIDRIAYDVLHSIGGNIASA